MNPTPRLRFVERTIETSPFYMTVTADGRTKRGEHSYRVLQQWFAYDINYPMTRGEWKDVPLEKENE